MQWYQLDNMQTIYASLQTDNHANTSSLNFYRPDALPDAQPTVSKHWRHTALEQYGIYCFSINNRCTVQRRTGISCICSVLTCIYQNTGLVGAAEWTIHSTCVTTDSCASLDSRVLVLGTCTGTWSVFKYHFQVLVLLFGTEVLVLVLVLETWVLVMVLVLETQVLVLVLVLEWLSTGYNSAGQCNTNFELELGSVKIRILPNIEVKGH